MRWAWFVAALAQLGGCSQLFGLHEPVLGDAGTDQSVAPDAGRCTVVETTCASPGILRSCAEIGAEAIDAVCTWGCIDKEATKPHCGQLSPAGGVLDGDDLAGSSMLGDVTIDALAIVDTNTGAISGIREVGPGVRAGIAFEQRSGAGVFTMTSLTINGPLQVIGSRPLALVVVGAVTINSGIDLRGTCVGTAAGPGGMGGGTGGLAGQTIVGAPSGAGTGGGSTDTNGGGGGGHGGGGGGGGSLISLGGPQGGTPFGTPMITVLRGGGAGGGGGGDGGGGGGDGGGGGGAIQIISNDAVSITTAGSINAGGCGGKAPSDNASGGGGGAGGTILIEAPTVTIAGILAVNGGGGASGHSNGVPGLAGRPDRTAALGGVQNGTGKGGDGAAAATSTGSDGAYNGESGGGGGGIGRIRINTPGSSANVLGTAVMSPAFADGTTASQGPVAVQ